MNRSSSSELLTHTGYPLASAFSFKNVLMYSTKRPPSSPCRSYCVTAYSYTSYTFTIRYPFETAKRTSSITHVPTRARSLTVSCVHSFAPFISIAHDRHKQNNNLLLHLNGNTG